ncbi:uncharacterized protein LOC144456287 [Phascolarctos cinereus]
MFSPPLGVPSPSFPPSRLRLGSPASSAPQLRPHGPWFPGQPAAPSQGRASPSPGKEPRFPASENKKRPALVLRSPRLRPGLQDLLLRPQFPPDPQLARLGLFPPARRRLPRGLPFIGPRPEPGPEPRRLRQQKGLMMPAQCHLQKASEELSLSAEDPSSIWMLLDLLCHRNKHLW